MKNKGLIIGLIAIIVILIGVVVFLLVRDNNEENVEATPTDAEKFAEEYPSMPDDNVFTYATVDEIIDVLDGGSGIVYLGFPECQWCEAYVPYLNEVAKDVGISEILYYNILQFLQLYVYLPMMFRECLDIVIVAYPTFQQTVNIWEHCLFLILHVFPYLVRIFIIQFHDKTRKIVILIECIFKFLAYGRQLEIEVILMRGLQIMKERWYRETSTVIKIPIAID